MDQRISRESIQQASSWMARLWADDVSDQDRQAFKTWLDANQDNQFAWQQLEKLQGKFTVIPQPKLSRKVLVHQRQGITRRQLLLWSGVSLGTVGVVLNSDFSLQPRGTEYRTAKGKTLDMTLSDGTQIMLNTSTRVIVDFNQQQRLLHLVEGEILVTTAHHMSPFHVLTKQGRVSPIGTQFTVHQREENTHVSVYQGAVELRPKNSYLVERLDAGKQTEFFSDRILKQAKNDVSDLLWMEHKIIAQGMKLTDFITELGRYRTGFIRLDPDLQSLKVTGAFSTSNTDQTLNNLSQILPIRVNYRTKYWVTIAKQ